MSQDPRYIEELVYKFRNGHIHSDELKTLLEWYNAHDDSQVEIPLPAGEQRNAVRARILDELRQRIERERAAFAQVPGRTDATRNRGAVMPRPLRPLGDRTIRSGWAAAAIFLFALVTTWVMFQYIGRNTGEQVTLQESTIEPGGNRATLILADGREIVLSPHQEGIVIGAGISYLDGTDLGDEALGLAGSGPAGQLIMQTPRGGTYQVTLPDGTEVWLNAGTTLKYPSQFDQEQRRVEVVGEAYFAVQPAYRSDGSKIPFRVISRQQEVEVLGTEFNISAYAEQLYSKTTLVEGQIRLKDSSNEFLMKPGDQATTNAATTTLRQVQTATFTAWRDGRFSFDGKPFAEIMNEIAHWYDLEIVYKGAIPDEELVGDAFRNQNLGLVLRVLDVAEIDYSIDVPNRKLIVNGKTTKPKH